MYSKEGVHPPQLVITTTSGDTTDPTVAIDTPASGSTVASAQTVTISATAADNERVERVEFYDGVSLRATDSTAPYSHDWSLSAGDNGTHTWTARAYDDAATAPRRHPSRSRSLSPTSRRRSR